MSDEDTPKDANCRATTAPSLVAPSKLIMGDDYEGTEKMETKLPHLKKKIHALSRLVKREKYC